VATVTLSAEGRRAVRDSLVVTVGGQLERALGTLTALALRWGLDPARLGVYTGLRLFLDNTNRSSLGISLGPSRRSRSFAPRVDTRRPGASPTSPTRPTP
jgi:hypothetical protein